MLPRSGVLIAKPMIVWWCVVLVSVAAELKENDTCPVQGCPMKTESNIDNRASSELSSLQGKRTSPSLDFSHLSDVDEITDDLYFSMPPLFDLDNYESCLARNGTFCLGSFHLTTSSDNQLYKLLQWVSSKKRFRFNHTLLHRGLCLNTSCSRWSHDSSPAQQFQQCVNDFTKTQYGLEASLIKLEYCKTAETPPRIPYDFVDHGFLLFCVALLAANFLGTAFDLFRNKKEKGNPLLTSWSIISNYRNLVRVFPDDDSDLSRFKSINGVKIFILCLTLCAHSTIVLHVGYIYNPQYVETFRRNLSMMIILNGSQAVQIYCLLTSFIFVHSFLLAHDHYTNKSPKLIFIVMLLRRISRIIPIHMFMVGFTATWSRFMSDGALWIPVMEKEAQVCRLKWWSNALFIHNFYRQNDHCLLQSWYLAVEMQLFTLVILIKIALKRWPNIVIRTLPVIFLLTVFCNFVVAYIFDFKASVYMTDPEILRRLHSGVPSFNWLYAAPWGSLPASLLGIMLAFLYHELRRNNVDLKTCQWFQILYRISVPSLFGWIFAGQLFPEEPSPFFSAFYAAVDRPMICIIFSVAFLGILHRVDKVYWRFFSWNGFQLMGRMSLCMLMVHWNFNLMQVGVQTAVKNSTYFEVGGHWLITCQLTLLASVPLHLLVEMPIEKFIRHSVGI